MTPDVVTAVKNAKAGQVRFRADKGGIIHGGIGKISFSAQAVKENLEALVTDLKRLKPATSKVSTCARSLLAPLWAQV